MNTATARHAAILAASVLALGATGCTITREVRPLALSPADKAICIVEAPEVREGFLRTYREELQKKGFTVRVLPPHSVVTTCPLTSTYVGRWSWDLAIYLNYAEITVYRDGAQAGRAFHDGRRGGANPGKFGSGEKRIAGLVAELFP